MRLKNIELMYEQAGVPNSKGIDVAAGADVFTDEQVDKLIEDLGLLCCKAFWQWLQHGVTRVTSRENPLHLNLQASRVSAS